MVDSAVSIDDRVDDWWRLFAVALFLLVPLDLLTTLLAVTRHGTVVEANPLMRWLLDQGLLAVTAANVAVVVVVVALFHVALEWLRRTPPSYHRAVGYVVDVWMGVLLVAGTLLVANNLLAVV